MGEALIYLWMEEAEYIVLQSLCRVLAVYFELTLKI